MKVVVQILLYNESFATIDTLLSSLERVEYPREDWALVIVNNRCAGFDIEEHWKQRWAVKVGVTLPKTIFQAQENDGFAGGHNSALALSRQLNPEFIYLLNGDAHVGSKVLAASVAYADAHPNAAVIQSRVMLDQDQTKLNSAGNALHFLGFGYSLGSNEVYVPGKRSTVPMFYASGAAVLLRTSVIDAIGLFESSYFMYHEDVDCSWRARLAGFDIAYVEDSVVFHHYEFSKSIKKFYWMERNRHLTNFTNYQPLTLLLIAPALMVMECGTLYFALRSGWAKEKVRSWWHFVQPSTWAFIARRRREVAAFRVVDDKKIIAFMCGVITNQEVDNPLLTRVVNPFMTGYLRVVQWFLS
jgi:GT2 family glycosyltransferase